MNYFVDIDKFDFQGFSHLMPANCCPDLIYCRYPFANNTFVQVRLPIAPASFDSFIV